MYKVLLYATRGMPKGLSRLKCSIPKEDDRKSLADKALKFLRQAPKNTEAHNASSSSTFHPDWNEM